MYCRNCRCHASPLPQLPLRYRYETLCQWLVSSHKSSQPSYSTTQNLKVALIVCKQSRELCAVYPGTSKIHRAVSLIVFLGSNKLGINKPVQFEQPWFQELITIQKLHGTLLMIPTSLFPVLLPPPQGFVYLKFVSTESATAAQHALHGRFFAGRAIACGFEFDREYCRHFGL